MPKILLDFKHFLFEKNTDKLEQFKLNDNSSWCLNVCLRLMNNVIMMKKLSYILFNILLIFEKIIRFLINRSFIVHFQISSRVSNKKININQKTITLYAPNQHKLANRNFIYKEPETIEWINSFSKKKILFFGIWGKYWFVLNL